MAMVRGENGLGGASRLQNPNRCYNATRSESHDLASPLQALMLDMATTARRDGRPIVMNTARDRIADFYEALAREVLVALPAPSDVSLVQAVIEETERQGPADVAAVEVMRQPRCRSALRRLVDSTRDHMRKAGRLLDRAERELAQANASLRVAR